MATSSDEYDLQRFLLAQQSIFDQAYGELLAGKKRSHWMWFIFPQIEGLGTSVMAQRYAISSREEASAYLAHSVLGPRLKQCTNAMLGHKGRSANEILGYPDDLKFHSSATLFGAVCTDVSVFHQVLECFFDGAPDARTLNRIGRSRV